MKGRKSDKRGRSKHGPPFVQLPHWLMDSFPWKQLTPVDRGCWLELMRLYNGSNNGRIAASTRRLAARMGVSHHTVARALNELMTFGFIERMKASSFSHKNRKASEYRLTHVRCDVTGALPSKKFMQSQKTTEQSHLSPTLSHGRDCTSQFDAAETVAVS